MNHRSRMFRGTTICSELSTVAAWNDSMYRNRSIATRFAKCSLLPRTRCSFSATSATGSTLTPICAVGAGLPSGIVGHCRGNTSDGEALLTHPRYSQGELPAWTYSASALFPSKRLASGMKRHTSRTSWWDAFAPTHCRRSRVQCVASVCVKDVEGMTKLLRTNTAPKIIGLGAGGAATIAISEDVSEPRAGKGNSALAKARCRGRGEGGAEDARRRASIGRAGDALVNARAVVRWSGRAPARRGMRGGNHRNPLFPSLPLAST